MATIADILRHKADTSADTSAGATAEGSLAGTVTLAPDTSIAQLATTLADRRIGAVVITDGDRVAGIVSERDVVRHVAAGGGLDDALATIMTTSVVTCGVDDALEDIAETMTQRRIRHMPVIDDDALVGIVSIGDVVFNRIRQLEQDRTRLEQYIAG